MLVIGDDHLAAQVCQRSHGMHYPTLILLSTYFYCSHQLPYQYHAVQ